MPPEKLIPLLVFPAVLALILLRNRRRRPLKLKFIWVTPAVVLPLIALGLWGSAQAPGAVHAPFGPAGWAILVLGGLLGGLAGWYRGKTVVIEKEPDGSLMAQASPLGLILLVALFAGRTALRDLIEGHVHTGVGLAEVLAVQLDRQLAVQLSVLPAVAQGVGGDEDGRQGA